MRYIFDLDNTLCDTKKNGDGNWNYLDSKPFKERIDIVNGLYEEGNYIVIETARGSVSKKNWYEQTYNQLVSFGLKFHELRTGVKFNGDIFIDDKGVNSEEFFKQKNINVVNIYPKKTNITLFNEIFVEKDELRLNEYVYCINKNIDNKLIEKIYLVCYRELYEKNKKYFDLFFNYKLKPNNKISLILDDKNKRFTFNTFMDLSKNLVGDNKIVCASNLDIFIPETEEWSNLEKDFFSITENECCLALSRTEYVNDSYSFRDEGAWDRGEFADCWVFKTPILIKSNDFPFEIPVGSAPTCDNYMFLIMNNTHKEVFNWAQKYITYHYDLIRKPDVLEKKSGRMIMNDDIVELPQNLFESSEKEKWTITPYQEWDKIFNDFVIDKKIKKKKMEKGAFEDRFAFEEISKLIDKFKIKRIVETGTYLGWSTKKLCEFGINVDSIEINEEFYDEAKKNLKFKNLKLHLGNSVDVLSEIIKEDEKNLLLFLDSHWYDLPLLKELNILAEKKINPVILIHDFFVPDEDGNAKFGFDSYDGNELNFNLIQNHIENIYGGIYEFHYTTEVDCVDSGIIYIYPKIETNE